MLEKKPFNHSCSSTTAVESFAVDGSSSYGNDTSRTIIQRHQNIKHGRAIKYFAKGSKSISYVLLLVLCYVYSAQHVLNQYVVFDKFI